MTCLAILRSVPPNYASAANRQRLASRVVQRRRELRLTQEQVYERGGPSTATLRLIEKGAEVDYRRGTIGPLERALEWTEGSIDAILHGDEATAVSESVSTSSEDHRVLLDIDDEVYEAMDPITRRRAKAEAEALYYRLAQEARQRADER